MVITRGRWYWWQCEACRWNGVRYRNVKKCPHCGTKPLTRFREAKPKEVAAVAEMKVSIKQEERAE